MQGSSEPRVHGREEIRHPAGGKPAKLQSLGFFVIHREKEHHQTTKSSVCHGLRPSQRPGGPLCFLCPLDLN